MSVEETLAAIDVAVGCQQCGRPLNGSVSDDFDTEECQAEWHAARASRLDGYEPVRASSLIGLTAWELGVATMRDEFIAWAYEQVRARQQGMRDSE